MEKLIKALQILLKYSEDEYPTHCEHDVLYVCVDPSAVSEEDKKELQSLGFEADEGEQHFYSVRFGSC